MSSLVFVVILAVWAVYLVQHWVRRRDHLATARSVDRFSEAMRVLERRRALPVPETDAQPSSYAASPLRPARPARPEVVVKRAGAPVHGATAVAPSRDHRRSHLVAQVRAGALLAGSLAMVVLVGLAVTGVFPRWTALVGVALCGAAFGAVRWSVARRQAAWRQSPRSAGARRAPAARVSATGRTVPVGHRPAGRAEGSSAPAPRHHPAAGEGRPVAKRPAGHPAAGRRTAAHPGRAPDGHEFSAQSVAATLRTAPRREPGHVIPADHAASELYDLHAVEASLAEAAPVRRRAPATGAEVPATPAEQPGTGATTAPAPADGTWDPVPVPPPTYTLKAKAYRPLPNGSMTLPADGTEMALDEEFEDLPRIDRVG